MPREDICALHSPPYTQNTCLVHRPVTDGKKRYFFEKHLIGQKRFSAVNPYLSRRKRKSETLHKSQITSSSVHAFGDVLIISIRHIMTITGQP